ncbi:hypothetical protein AGMMS49574_14110 [Bacteroidia bacterium]|nr:hypothetical protein AGMMS49574_14110 [Bacteroidia bacterium]
MQDLINKYFYILFLVTYIFGLLFYNEIHLLTDFQWTDEVCALTLLTGYLYIVFTSKEWYVNKAFLVTLFIFLFYIAYSFKIGSNSPKAIIMDVIIQIKPYLVFFCVYQLKPYLDKNRKVLLNQISLVVWFIILVPIGVLGLINERYIWDIVEHPTSYASTIIATSLIYLFTSDYTLKNRLVFIGLLAIGLISGRAKFYGFFVMAGAIVLYFDNIDKIKLNLKNVSMALVLVAVTLFVAKDKIEMYFVQGFTQDVEMDYVARFALYGTSFSIFADYFPFGSGFASFATHASGVYYSDIYALYGIDSVWGLSKSYTSFITDTYYPSLAQFGVVGVVLFMLFWVYVVIKGMSIHAGQSLLYFSLALIIVCYFLIENIADSTFTGNRGLFMMLLLGYILSNLSHEKEELVETTEVTEKA